MSGISVSLDVKDMFFDRARVLEQIGRENAKRLSRAGAFIRQTAQRDVLKRASSGRGKKKKRSPSAKPGQPPLVHSRDSRASLRFILFSLDRDWESVVIGPVGLPSRRLRNSTAQTVPELMEFGGTAMVGRKRRHYAKHPFMSLALQMEVDKGTIGNLWRSR